MSSDKDRDEAPSQNYHGSAAVPSGVLSLRSNPWWYGSVRPIVFVACEKPGSMPSQSIDRANDFNKENSPYPYTKTVLPSQAKIYKPSRTIYKPIRKDGRVADTYYSLRPCAWVRQTRFTEYIHAQDVITVEREQLLIWHRRSLEEPMPLAESHLGRTNLQKSYPWCYVKMALQLYIACFLILNLLASAATIPSLGSCYLDSPRLLPNDTDALPMVQPDEPGTRRPENILSLKISLTASNPLRFPEQLGSKLQKCNRKNPSGHAS